MKTVAIICEYNPFHLGHKVQIDSIRNRFSDEAVCVIALMSGAYVQRGGMAVLSRAHRAETALEMGVDLVLELPFPWSMSGADYFARGAVSILEAMGGIDYLCFGSECGELDRLALEAERLSSQPYQTALDRVAASHPTLSWAAMRERAYLDTYGIALGKYSPNDLLAIAYLTHLKQISPLPIKRQVGYSASAAREAFASGDDASLAGLVPPQTLALLQSKSLSASADSALLAALRMTDASELACYAEGSPELAGLIERHLPNCQSVDALVRACTNKRYTSARVRRAVWHCFLRTPPSLPKSAPAYTRLLGCNRTGREWLAAQRKTASLPVITRLSNAKTDPQVEMQFRENEKRDALRAFLLQESEKTLPIIK